MSRNGERITSPVVMGIVAAVTSLLVALAVCVIPALAAQLAADRSSATALDAVLIGLSFLVLGHGGGLILDAGVVRGALTITPLGTTALFLLVIAGRTRTMARALGLVTEAGRLRERAMRDAGTLLAVCAGVYGLALGFLAAIARSSDFRPVPISAIVSGALVAVVGGLIGILWALALPRRDGAIPGLPLLGLLPSPFDQVARALGIALAALAGLGMLAVTVLLLISSADVVHMTAELRPGIVGGLVLILLQLALLPSFGVWAVMILCGGTVTLGSGTAFSLAGATTGVMPALPMLGMLPGPGTAPWPSRLLVLLPIAVVALGAVRLVRGTRELDQRDRWIAWGSYPVVLLLVLLALAGLSGGGIGSGRLQQLGPLVPGLLLPLLGITVLTTAVVVLVEVSGAVAWLQDRVARVRTGVENLEQAERGAGSERGERSDDELSGDGKSAEDRGATDDRGDESVEGVTNSTDR